MSRSLDCDDVCGAVSLVHHVLGHNTSVQSSATVTVLSGPRATTTDTAPMAWRSLWNDTWVVFGGEVPRLKQGLQTSPQGVSRRRRRRRLLLTPAHLC